MYYCNILYIYKRIFFTFFSIFLNKYWTSILVHTIWKLYRLRYKLMTFQIYLLVSTGIIYSYANLCMQHTYTCMLLFSGKNNIISITKLAQSLLICKYVYSVHSSIFTFICTRHTYVYILNNKTSKQLFITCMYTCICCSGTFCYRYTLFRLFLKQ